VTGTEDAAAEVIAGLARLGIDVAEVTHTLEIEGITKFETSWSELLSTVADGLARVRA